jgi:hypothetical protein
MGTMFSLMAIYIPAFWLCFGLTFGVFYLSGLALAADISSFDL